VVQFYRVRRAFRACATSVEHDSPNRCGVRAPGTVLVGGPYSLGEFLQWRMGTISYMVRQTDDDERAKAERLQNRLEEKDSKMRKSG
jgi:hypothetical protein